ncbi:hypothetical protein [Asticcacaulis sp.]|uniref:hypothetical protein n=1 Tax=Asticcacaulis sp. TaxID=1872648 RepID=UPI003F7BA9F8
MRHSAKAQFGIKKLLVGACLLTITLGLYGCSPSYMRRLLVTIEVNDNGTILTGSSVQKVGCRAANPTYGGLDVGGCYIEGDAAYVHLKNGQHLILTYVTDEYRADPRGYANSILNRHDLTSDFSWDVPEDEIPQMVTFKNSLDPDSVVRVYPADAEQILGSGVKIGKIHVALTDLPVNEGNISKVFPWIKDFVHLSKNLGENGAYIDNNSFTSKR